MSFRLSRLRLGMHITILTVEGFNELDSLIAYAMLNRVRQPDWRVSIASPTAKVRSVNGLVHRTAFRFASRTRCAA
jgi:hypothetical protein